MYEYDNKHLRDLKEWNSWIHHSPIQVSNLNCASISKEPDLASVLPCQVILRSELHRLSEPKHRHSDYIHDKHQTILLELSYI